MKVPAPSLAPILRSDVQGRILARLMTTVETGQNLTELVAWTHSSMPTVMREVDRAERAGIVTSQKVGPTRVIRANPGHPLYEALSRVILASYGPPAIIAREFCDLAGAQAVILFGSWAARYQGEAGRAPNDIDVLVIGSPDRDTVDDAAERAERAIGLPVQATVRTTTQWRDASDNFIREVKRRPYLVVLDDGELDDGDVQRAADTEHATS